MAQDKGAKGALVSHLTKDDHGVTSIEYAFIGALIAIVIVTAIGQIGTTISASFNTIAGNL